MGEEQLQKGSLKLILLTALAVSVIILALAIAFALKGKPPTQTPAIKVIPTPSLSTNSAAIKTNPKVPKTKGPTCVPTPQQPLCLPK